MLVKLEGALAISFRCMLILALISNYVIAKGVIVSEEKIDVGDKIDVRTFKNYSGNVEKRNGVVNSILDSVDNDGNRTSDDDKSFLRIPINSFSIAIIVILVILILLGTCFVCLFCIYVIYIINITRMVIRRDDNRL